MEVSSTLRRILAVCLAVAASKVYSADKIREMIVPYVDIQRFMGPWYVQGHTPLVIDDDSSNQVETYELKEDGTIATTFNFERFGRQFTLNPKGWVFDKDTNAHWKMQFVWPMSSDYLIVRLKPDYSMTVVSVPGKDLIWIMTRTPVMSAEHYQLVVEDLRMDGYDLKNLRRVPQK